ncbi:MAG TPA: CHRD domain-containing protein [Planctomycetota bacterium]|nr:CHRD domain-containing protein [Planctomycetota bacterium]
MSLQRLSPRLALSLPFALAALVTSAAAQDLYAARLSHANAVPPTATPATGRGWFHFDRSTDVLHCRVETNAPATHVHVRRGAAGTNGPVVLALTKVGPLEWEGATPALAGGDVSDLWHENLYVAVFTNASPPLLTGGAIRDQLTRSHARILAGTFSPGASVPPSSSNAFGIVRARVRLPESVVTYDVEVSSLATPVLGLTAELHLAAPGATGPLVCALEMESSPSAPKVTWSGTTPTLTTAQIDALLAGTGYVTVASIAFPLGETRAQLGVRPEELVAVHQGSVAGEFVGSFTLEPDTNVVNVTCLVEGADPTSFLSVEEGAPGAFGVPVYSVGVGSGTWVGSHALSPDEVDDLFAGLHYLRLTQFSPFVILRDQIRPDPALMGWPGPTSDGPLGRVLRVGARGDGSIGSTVTVTLHGAAPGAAVSLGIGTNVPNPLPIPFDLAAIGAPGHHLWVSPDIGLGATAGATGSASIDLAIPAAPFLAGAAVPFQWLSIESGANPLGLVSSDAMRMVLVP